MGPQCVVCKSEEALLGEGRPECLCFICETVLPFAIMSNVDEIKKLASDDNFCRVALAFHGGYSMDAEIEPGSYVDGCSYSSKDVCL